MNKLIILLSVMLFTSFYTYSQNTIRFNWDNYGMTFNAPINFMVEKETAEEFVAKLPNDNLNLSIIPWKNNALTSENLHNSLRDLCLELGYSISEIGTIRSLNLNSYESYYVDVTKGSMNLIIQVLLDKNNDTHFYNVIVYTPKFKNEALDIAASFSH